MTKPGSSFAMLDEDVRNCTLYDTPNCGPGKSLTLYDSIPVLGARGFDDISRAVRCMLK